MVIRGFYCVFILWKMSYFYVQKFIYFHKICKAASHRDTWIFKLFFRSFFFRYIEGICWLWKVFGVHGRVWDESFAGGKRWYGVILTYRRLRWVIDGIIHDVLKWKFYICFVRRNSLTFSIRFQINETASGTAIGIRLTKRISHCKLWHWETFISLSYLDAKVLFIS